MMLLTILVIVLVLAIAGAGFGHSRFGFAGWSPVGVVLLVVMVLWFTGHMSG